MSLLLLLGSASQFSGILDTIGVNHVAAYSLRRLRGGYTGNCVNVRRSSDDALLDIGFDSNGDFDQTAFSAFVGGGSGYVKKWYDQSGNGYDVVQTTNASQPTLTPLDYGQKPAISFNGTTNTLLAPDPALLDLLDGSLSVYGVCSIDVDGYIVICGKGQNAVSGFRCFMEAGRRMKLWYGNDGEPYSAQSAVLTLSTKSSVFWGRDVANGNSQAGLGATLAEAAQTVNQSWDGAFGFAIGSDSSSNYKITGKVYEIIVAAEATTPTKFADMNTSHQSYWGTP